MYLYDTIIVHTCDMLYVWKRIEYEPKSDELTDRWIDNNKYHNNVDNRKG